MSGHTDLPVYHVDWNGVNDDNHCLDCLKSVWYMDAISLKVVFVVLLVNIYSSPWQTLYFEPRVGFNKRLPGPKYCNSRVKCFICHNVNSKWPSISACKIPISRLDISKISEKLWSSTNDSYMLSQSY